MSRKRRSGALPLFMGLSAALLLAAIFFGLNAMSKADKYTYEASITPTPTITPRSVSVTRDPNAVTATPAPTAVLFRNGDQGESVTAIQNRLKELGYYTIAVDGQYGNGTKNAVIWFQTQHGLDADGIVGEKTYELLFSDAAQKAVATATPVSTETDVLAGDTPILVNRQHTVSSDFKPADLVYLKDLCPSDLIKVKGDKIQGVRGAVEALVTMLEAAKEDGLTVFQISAGYRSYAYQKQLFDEKVQYFMNNGSSRNSAISSARVTVADPGASEHHLGLAFDITVPNTQTFLGTAQCTWLHEHCWEYGFILRYTDEKEKITGYTGEAWHFRYVGLPHSTIIHENNWCLEEYIDYLNNQN